MPILQCSHIGMEDPPPHLRGLCFIVVKELFANSEFSLFFCERTEQMIRVTPVRRTNEMRILCLSVVVLRNRHSRRVLALTDHLDRQRGSLQSTNNNIRSARSF